MSIRLPTVLPFLPVPPVLPFPPLVPYDGFSMQYLRMLTNSVFGGALLAAYLVVLLLQLNPALDLRSAGAVPLILTWWLFYGVHAAVLFYVLIVIRQLLAAEVRPPGWISFRLLAWLGASSAAFAAAVDWLNLRGFGAALEPDAADRMVFGAVVLSVCAALSVLLAATQMSSAHAPRRRVCAALLALVLVASLAVPLGIRGPGRDPGEATRPRVWQGDLGSTISPPQTNARVAMILLEGASLDFIAPIAAGGRLPNFGRLLEDGAIMHLATLRPTQPEPVWTAVATGKLPYKNGIRSAARYTVSAAGPPVELLPDFCFAQGLIRFGFVAQQPHSSVALTVPPLWQLLGSFGITTGVVGWPLTYPVPAVRGYMVSDEFLRLQEPSLLEIDPAMIHPPELVGIARSARRAAPETALFALAADHQSGPKPAAGRLPAPAGPVALDVASERLAADLQRAQPARFTAVRYPGIDTVGHYYLRYATPRAFGDVSDGEREQFGRVMEEYYAFVDGILGRAMASLGPDDLLLVVSGFGMEPLSLGKRALERLVGDPDLSGSHEQAPDGFLLAYGRPVARGSLPRASVVDIAPTVLYFLGLPIGRDMDGYARTDIFTAGFTAERPITFIPYY